MFAFKTLVGRLLMPLPVAAMLVFIGIVLALRGYRRTARMATAGGALIGFGASLSPVGHALVAPLEARYPAVIDAAALDPAPKFVVVLGGGYQRQAGWPITAQLTPTSMVRLAEGLRLWRQLPGARLILSGGAAEPGQVGTARGYALAAAALGVSGAPIIIINDRPLDTRAEIRAVREEVADSPVLLVTSAVHMPRAMAYCSQFGVRAVAAPTGYLTQPGTDWNLAALIPSSLALQKTETALHEYWGLASQRAGGP
jgi:uncharacterized SAM-binding protein YcdF (DUF218 family)